MQLWLAVAVLVGTAQICRPMAKLGAVEGVALGTAVSAAFGLPLLYQFAVFVIAMEGVVLVIRSRSATWASANNGRSASPPRLASTGVDRATVRRLPPRSPLAPLRAGFPARVLPEQVLGERSVDDAGDHVAQPVATVAGAGAHEVERLASG